MHVTQLSDEIRGQRSRLRMYLNDNLSGRAVLYTFFLVLFFLKLCYYFHVIPVGIPPDEWAHISYLKYVSENNNLVPDFKQIKLIHPSNLEYSDKTNYLCHPPFYYHLLDITAKHLLCVDSVSKATLPLYRMINVFLSTLSVFLLFLMVYRLPLPMSYHLFLASALVSIPMMGIVGTAINNDNLAILGGSLLIFSSAEFLRSGKTPYFFLVLIGVVISSFAKLTGALLSYGYLLILLFFLYRRSMLIGIVSKYYLFIVILVLRPVCYYLLILFTYGTVQPSAKMLDYETYRSLVLSTVNPKTPVMGLCEYLRHFFGTNLLLSFSGIVAHKNLLKQSYLQQLPFLVIIIVPIISLFRPKIQTSGDYTEIVYSVSRYSCLSIVAVLIVHFVRAYYGYLENHYLGGAQARYYFPLVSALPVICGISIHSFFRKRFKLVGCLTAILLSCLFVYFDLFYFIMKLSCKFK